jgi:hypothetical protein
MSDERWVAVGTGLLALMTFILAVITAWNVRKTGRLVEATEKSASAAAATVLEIQRDRELAHRPNLDWTAKHSLDPSVGTPLGTASVTNTGRGLALNCLCCLGWALPVGAASTPITISTELFDLKPDATKDQSMRQRAGAQLDSGMAGAEVGEKPVAVAFCQDELGNYFRFVPFKSPDVHRTTDETEPRWMIFYRDQFGLLAKY